MTILEIILIVLLVIYYFAVVFLVWLSKLNKRTTTLNFLQSLIVAIFIPISVFYWYGMLLYEFVIKPLLKKGE